MRFTVPLLLAMACTSEVAPQYGVASTLLISRAEDNVSSGFDLDGLSSEEDGETGCGIGDYTSELGEPGVDNAIARLVPILEQTEAIAAEDLIHQAINSGELLILFEMNGLDELSSTDQSVDLSVLRGAGSPIVGTDGTLVSGQTFDIDPTVDATGQADVTLEDGILTAEDMTLTIPLEIFDAKLTAILENASVRIFWNEDGSFHGYMGGALDYWAIVNMAIDSNVDQALAESLPLLFGANADLDPNGTGTCTHISFTFTFTGVSAFVFDTPAE